MLGNRRNLIFRVSIVINVAVLLYAALHFSGNGPTAVEWVPVSAESAERLADVRFRYDVRNDSVEPSARVVDESTSARTPSTVPTTNRTAPSTASLAELDKKISASSEPEATDEVAFELPDENVLTDATLARLKAILGCTERHAARQTRQRGEFWVLENYVRAEHGPLLCQETVTYTTHAGFEFLDNVQPLVERWMAPISVAIHAPGADLAPTVRSIRYLRDCLGNELVRNFITFHVFFSHKHIPSQIPNPDTFLSTPYNCSLDPPYVVNSSTTYMKQKDLLYPVNVARNVARDAALTHFILPSDIELYPSPNLVPKFLNMIARNANPLNNSTNPRVFPISIFEVNAKVQVPSTKTELRAMLANKSAIPFHKFVCPDCHNIPQGAQWMKALETDQMDVFHVGKRQGKFVHWEPIFIGTHSDPYYDERLSWEGKKDKMTQGYVLCVKNYDFMILNNAFLTHKPGIKHFRKNAKRDAIAHRQNKFVFQTILPELKKLYGVKNGCAL